MLTRRRAMARGIAATAPVVLGWTPFCATAGTFPDRPIRAILPAPAGGVIDFAGRAISEAMAANLGQPLLIDPRPGGNGIVAGVAVAASPPDGYTTFLTVSGMMVLPLLVKAPFDMIRDFTPIAMLGVSSSILCVHPSLPVGNVAELVAYARATPGKLNYLNAGNGTPGHMVFEALKIARGLDITSITYKGLPPGIPDLVAGRIEMAVVSTSLIQQQAKAGATKAIAILGPRRLTEFPGIATLGEQGYGDIEVLTWIAFLGPPKMPDEIVGRLNAAVGAALADPVSQRRLAAADITPMPMSARQLGDAMVREYDRLGALISRLGIKADGGA